MIYKYTYYAQINYDFSDFYYSCLNKYACLFGSIQVMTQNAYGDYQKSRQVLNFLLNYQQGLGADYALHIVPDYEDEEFGNW